jgi:hypothetical protein
MPSEDSDANVKTMEIACDIYLRFLLQLPLWHFHIQRMHETGLETEKNNLTKQTEENKRRW